MGEWFSNLFSGFGSNGASSALASSAPTLTSTSSSMFPSVFNGGASAVKSGLGTNLGSDFGSMFSGINVPTSAAGSTGGLFANMNFDDLTNLGGLALGGLQYKQSRDAYKHQANIQDEQMQNTREDRAYNKKVRERARNLRF